jgi:hypothetical protein
MSTSIDRLIARHAASGRQQGTDVSPVVEETSHSLYLRQWLTHRAAQHRSLLLNINAVARIDLAPTVGGQ